MTKPEPMGIERTDLTTLLGVLASQLRIDGFAIIGLAAERFSPVEREYRDLEALSSSLDRTARMLDAARDRLCAGCQMIEVSEHVRFGAPEKKEAEAPEPSVTMHHQPRQLTRKGRPHKHAD